MRRKKENQLYSRCIESLHFHHFHFSEPANINFYSIKATCTRCDWYEKSHSFCRVDGAHTPTHTIKELRCDCLLKSTPYISPILFINKQMLLLFFMVAHPRRNESTMTLYALKHKCAFRVDITLVENKSLFIFYFSLKQARWMRNHAQTAPEKVAGKDWRDKSKRATERQRQRGWNASRWDELSWNTLKWQI